MTNFGLVHLVFYSCVSALYVWAFIVDGDLQKADKFKNIGFPFDGSFGGRVKFLTFIDMGLQAVYFGIGAALAFGDFICKRFFTCCKKKDAKSGSCEKCDCLKSTFSYVRASLIFPIGAVRFILVIEFFNPIIHPHPQKLRNFQSNKDSRLIFKNCY